MPRWMFVQRLPLAPFFRVLTLAGLLLLLGRCAPLEGLFQTEAPAPTTVETRPASPVPSSPMAPTSTPAPTPTPTPLPRVLVLCYGREPRSLYLYSGRLELVAWNLLQLLYDGPIDYRNFQDVPVLLERLPSLENGDAEIRTVQVRLGEKMVDAEGRVVRLQAGVRYRPAGCADTACARTLGPEEETATLDQLVVRFRLRDDARWSDGQPVTAADSVFSFRVAQAEGSVPNQPWVLQRTAQYTALDERTVEWVGLPGFLNNTYARNFWTPLPSHRLGQYDVSTLNTLEEVHRRPLGWGAYQLNTWEPGKFIEFVPNPYYFRRDEGLPRFTKVLVRFFPNPEEALAALMTGECDFVSETVGLEHQTKLLFALAKSDKVQVSLAPGPALEHLGFVLYHQALDDGLQYKDPSWPLHDERVRKAIAMCIDREAIIREVYGGFVAPYTSYLPEAHPLAVKTLPTYPYDPEQAQKLLEEAGWVDHDRNPQTPRQYRGKPSLWVRPNAPLHLVLATTQAPLRREAAARIQQDLAQCGIQVEVQTYPPEEFLATGPEGPVFGRRVHMALFAWTLHPEIMCHLWLSEAIPGPPEVTIGDVLWMRRVWPKEAHQQDAFRYDWEGWNYHAYSQPAFDEACRRVLLNPPEREGYQEAFTFTQARLAQDLPLLPLYTQMSMVAMRADFCGYTPDPGSPLELRDVEAFDYGEGCQP